MKQWLRLITIAGVLSWASTPLIANEALTTISYDGSEFVTHRIAASGWRDDGQIEVRYHEGTSTIPYEAREKKIMLRSGSCVLGHRLIAIEAEGGVKPYLLRMLGDAGLDDRRIDLANSPYLNCTRAMFSHGGVGPVIFAYQGDIVTVGGITFKVGACFDTVAYIELLNEGNKIELPISPSGLLHVRIRELESDRIFTQGKTDFYQATLNREHTLLLLLLGLISGCLVVYAFMALCLKLTLQESKIRRMNLPSCLPKQ